MRSYAKNPLIRKFFSFILVVAMVLSLTSDYHYGFAFNDTHNNIRKMSESLNDTMNKEEKVTPKAVTGSAIVGAKVVSGSAIGKNQTTNTEELNIDVSSVYYNKQDGPKTDVDLTSKLVDLTSQNGSINHYIHMSIDFDIVNSDPSTRNIKPGDYFDIPCPNAFEFNMMNSQDSIYDQTNTIVVAKYELIDEGSQQVLRVRFTDVIGEDANDGAGYWDIRCKLEVTYLMRKKNLSSEPQEFLFVLQNAEDGLLFKLPSASSLPPKGFTKSGLYDKETKTIDWTITIGEDEIQNNYYTVKNLATGEQSKVEEI